MNLKQKGVTMKLLKLTAVAATAAILTSCQYTKLAVPGDQLPLDVKAIQLDAKYEVIGDAVGTSSGATLFGFINIGGESKTGNLIGGPLSIMDPINDAALYNAIESVEGADGLVAARTLREGKDWFIYKKETVTIKGKAVRLKSLK